MTSFQESCRALGVAGEVTAMTASCDSWFYNNQLHIPSLVFGPGSLGYAHTNNEQIGLDEISEGAAIVLRFIGEWCG